MKVAIYTCITNDYDQLKESFGSFLFDFYCFTDNVDMDPLGWRLININPEETSHKYVKCNIHKLIPDYDYYIYIDASFLPNKKLESFFKNKKHFELVLTLHPRRKSIMEEATHCEKVGKISFDQKESIFNLIENFKDRHLYEMGFFLRKNKKEVNDFFEDWYNYIEVYSQRDQLTAPICLSRHKKNIKFNDITPSYRNDYVKLFPHKGNLDFKILYTTPFSSEKNVGREYNRICSKAEEGEWICIRDADTMFLRSDFGAIIQDNIKKYPNARLFGCLTNRLGLEYQLYKGEISENPDILYHKNICDKIYIENKNTSTITKKPIAGFFMLFHKSLWNEFKFCDGMTNDKNELFDWDFSKRVIEAGEEVRIMQDLYLFHYYRFKEGGKQYIEHLL